MKYLHLFLILLHQRHCMKYHQADGTTPVTPCTPISDPAALLFAIKVRNVVPAASQHRPIQKTITYHFFKIRTRLSANTPTI